MTARHSSQPTDADALDAIRELGEARQLRQRRHTIRDEVERLDCAVVLARMRVEWIADRRTDACALPQPIPPCVWCDGTGTLPTGIVCRTCHGTGESR